MKVSTSFLSDTDVLERVLSHIANKDTDRGDAIWREPVENYLSEERLTAEKRMIARAPSVFCPSICLEEVGSYYAREVAGLSLVAVRGHDRSVRVFKNACRHRGAQLVQGAGNKRALVCPYHGWAYRLDGHLQSIPDEDGFDGLDKSCHGLVQLPTIEKHGLVFVTLDPDTAAPDSSKGVLEFLPALFGANHKLFDVAESVVEANWKLHIESFIEGYHIRHAHPETFYPYGFDNLNVVELCGPHSRVTYPFRRIEAQREIPPAKRDAKRAISYLYHLFPNTIVSVLSHHTNILLINPVSVSQTRQVSFRIAHGSDDKAIEDAWRDANFVSTAAVDEDLALVTGIQRSLKTGANEALTFGKYEAAIAHFHKTLSENLAPAQS